MAVLDTMRTDIMHKAAVNIQRHVRGFVVRRKVHRIVRAVIKIQVCWLKSTCWCNANVESMAVLQKKSNQTAVIIIVVDEPVHYHQ